MIYDINTLLQRHCCLLKKSMPAGNELKYMWLRYFSQKSPWSFIWYFKTIPYISLKNHLYCRSTYAREFTYFFVRISNGSSPLYIAKLYYNFFLIFTILSIFSNLLLFKSSGKSSRYFQRFQWKILLQLLQSKLFNRFHHQIFS